MRVRFSRNEVRAVDDSLLSMGTVPSLVQRIPAAQFSS